MSFEKIKSFFREINNEYYFKHRPLSWLLLINPLLLLGFIGIAVLILITSIVFLIIKFNSTFITIMDLTLLMVGFFALLLSLNLWMKLILQTIENNLKDNKRFFLSSLWKNWFIFEDKIINNNHISKIIKINTFFVNPKNRLKSRISVYKRLVGILSFLVLFFYFIYSMYSFAIIHTYPLNIAIIIAIFILSTLILPPVSFFAAYLITGKILLIIEKFKPTPELNQEEVTG
jgi:hypothetical protein